jgi:hypothetical protein
MTAHFTENQHSLAQSPLGQWRFASRHLQADQLFESPSHVQVVLKGQIRLGRRNTWAPRPGRLTMDDRGAISFGLRSGDSMSSITRQIAGVRRQ